MRGKVLATATLARAGQLPKADPVGLPWQRFSRLAISTDHCHPNGFIEAFQGSLLDC